MNITCEACGLTFRVKPSHARRRVWCSVGCKAAGERRRCFLKIERRYGRPIREVFDYLYTERQLSIRAVAAELNTSTRTVLDWFNALDIPRRNLTDAVKLQWKHNAERRAAIGNTMREWKRRNPEAARACSIKANLTQQNMRGPTSIERRMMEAFDAAGLGYEFQFAVGGKFLCDFAFPEARIIVECDGEYWHSKPRQRKKDASKDAYLRACGYTVLRFTGKEINTDARACAGQVAKLFLLPSIPKGCARNGRRPTAGYA